MGQADFLFGQVESWNVNINPMTGGRTWNLQAFVQDDYKIKRNLTLNLGVRYQLQTGWGEAYNRIGLFDPDLTNPATGTPGAMWFAPRGGRTKVQDTIPAFFVPRIGVAWQPAEGWSIRASYGIFSHMWGGNTYYRGAGVGYNITGSDQSSDTITPIFALSDGAPDPIFPNPEELPPDLQNGNNTEFFARDTPMSYVHQWSLDIQRELARNLMIEAAYVGSHTTNLGYASDRNQVPLAQLGPGDTQLRRPFPQFRNINTPEFTGWSNYHSLQVTLRKQFSHGFSLVTNYTYSKMQDTGTGSGWGSLAAADSWQIARDPRANYALSQIDTPHLWNGAIIWELPFGVGRQFLSQGGVADAILGGWQISSLWSANAGRPFTPRIGTANLSGALSGTWRPMRLGEGSLSNPTIDRYFDVDAFGSPEPFTFGNSGRNIIRGPSYWNFNMSVAKSFSLGFLGEAGRLQFRGDARNLPNHPNFRAPNTGIGTAGAGVITRAANGRTIQLGLKIEF